MNYYENLIENLLRENRALQKQQEVENYNHDDYPQNNNEEIPENF